MKDKNLIDKIKAREIVSEIMQYGVNQEQITTIIKLLALELEDRALMLDITNMLSTDVEAENKPQITL